MERLRAYSRQDLAVEVCACFIPDFSEWTKPGKFEREFVKLCKTWTGKIEFQSLTVPNRLLK
ncbi:MAG: hypothetical protein ACREDQ_06550 [Limisphaerales bacterium]